MLISYNWLKNYVDLPDSLTPEELALKLTMSTVEVEGTERQGELLDGVVVGEILEIKKHPDADKLSVAQVDVGEEKPRQIVFGQMVEMEVGFKVPVALAPTKLPGDKEIKKAKLRGIASEGMLCLDQEMGLAKEGVSIRFFDKETKNGTPIIKELGLNDVVIDIDNKSMTHRPDLWGHYGMAREVAALYHKKLKEYPVKEKGIRNKEKINYKLQVDVEDTKLCPRYMAVIIDGVKIAPSPEWLQKKLLAVGLRPINNIVDITNYILFDLGQPMHAFDKSKVESKKLKVEIVVRHAEDGEKFITLDGQEHELSSDMLVIADQEKAVALAGVMGGLESGVSDDTTTIVFESANFDALNIRRTATRLGIRTDSSARFEKSLDPNNCELALRRAVELTLELCPDAKVVSKVVDESNFSLFQGPIELSLEFLNKKIGVKLEKKEVIKILESLGFKIKDQKNILSVHVPTWRATKDISIPEDLVEEVARIYGYGNIPTVLPTFSIVPPERNELKILERKLKDILSLEFGFDEVYNYSFISPKWIEIAGLDEKDLIKLDNPIAKDRPYLRHNLWPNLLENVEKNLHEFDNIKIFEVGQIFDKNNPGVRIADNSDELLPRQNLMLGLAFASKGVDKPFYELSEVVQGIFDHFNCEYEIKIVGETKGDFIHPGRIAEIVVNNDVVGTIGEIHPTILEEVGIGERTALVEINLNKLVEQVTEKNNYQRLPAYPVVERDVAFLVDKKVLNSDIISGLKNIDGLIREVELFDVYEGNKIPAGKKSLAYRITYRSDEKTLESVEVDKVHDRLVKMLEKEFGAEVRK